MNNHQATHLLIHHSSHAWPPVSSIIPVRTSSLRQQRTIPGSETFTRNGSRGSREPCSIDMSSKYVLPSTLTVPICRSRLNCLILALLESPHTRLLYEAHGTLATRSATAPCLGQKMSKDHSSSLPRSIENLWLS